MYFFWILRISGASSCDAREALVCLLNSGMMRMRMMIVRPTIDSTHAGPAPACIPIAVSAV